MAGTFKELTAGGSYFESPRWHDGRWWVSDFYLHGVSTLDEDGAAEVIMEVQGQPSGIGWLPDGSMLVVSMKDQKILRRDREGTVTEHADVSEHCGGHLNDMVVNADGHAYVGNFGFDLMAGADPALANLVHVDPEGHVEIAAKDLWFPNGSVITDDNVLLVGETMGSRYTAFDMNEDGSLSNRRVWAQLAEEPPLGSYDDTIGSLQVGPDGCTLDAENHLWSADAMGARLMRISPGGEIVDERSAPGGLGVFACMLGGADGRTLLACAAPDFAEHNRAPVREAVLLTTQVEVPHAGRP